MNGNEGSGISGLVSPFSFIALILHLSSASLLPSKHVFVYLPRSSVTLDAVFKPCVSSLVKFEKYVDRI